MCGICGWFGDNKSADEKQALQSMLDNIRHRGPDGYGTLHLPGASLAHARLAIIDPEDGAQPMTTSDNQLVITFNGEIYNYHELRSSLIERGCRFLTHSDTEVILWLYREYGIAGFSRLRGMYAFAIWDSSTDTGILVRDPFGIKPLFIRQLRHLLLFGSEAKAILAHPECEASLDPASLHLLMNFRYLPGGRTLFRDIHQIPPGEAWQWQQGQVIERRTISSETPGASVCDAIEDSVRVHFTADVEVACYLSGGIDSATIAAIGCKTSDNRLRSFTLAVGDDPEEAANAAQTARLLGIDNIQQSVSFNPRKDLSHLVRHLELPKINALQVSMLARLAAPHVKVCLSGLGGDELFMGYNAHRIFQQAVALAQRVPSWLTHTAGTSLASVISLLSRCPWTEAERGMRMLAGLKDWPRVYGLLRNVWDHPSLREMIYGPRMLDTDLPDAFASLKALWPDEKDPLTAMAMFEFRHKMINDLLWQEDRVSMAEGLEVRVPFIDKVVVASAAPLDGTRHMTGNNGKRLLRECATHWLPQAILHRPKSGFQIDAPTFFHQHLMPLAQDLLHEERVRRIGLFNPKFVNRILTLRPHRRMRWHYFMLYLMLMTHLWMEIFVEHDVE